MAAKIPFGVRAVFFDAVGTLIFPDPPALVIYAEVARRQGLNLSPEEVRTRFLRAYRAEEDVDRLSGWVTSEEREESRWRQIISKTLAGIVDTEACFRELYEHFSRPVAWRISSNAKFVFERLLDLGVLLGLGSNYDSRLLSVLEGFPELALLRERVVICATVGYRKPAREFFREIVRVAGCKPGEVLFVGDDRENDYKGATSVGMHAVLLDERDRERAVGYRIQSLVELLASTGHSG